MDLSAQYQQQQSASQTYDSSQLNQPYDQSTLAAYYAYNHHYPQYDQYTNQQQQQQQYPYYNYTNAYQPQQQSRQEPTSIHPPGVPIPPEPIHLTGSEQVLRQTHVPNQLNLFYAQIGSSEAMAAGAVAGVQGQQWQDNIVGFGSVPIQSGPRPPIGQPLHRGAVRRGGKPFRGGGRAHFGPRPDGSGPPSHGRGRGRHSYGPSEIQMGLTRGEVSQIQGEPTQSQMPPSYTLGSGQVALPDPGQGCITPAWPPPRMAWCELCRVDCNTPEILQQHKNGKRHKKNLQVYEELQKLNKLLVGQNENIPTSENNLEVSDQPERVEKSEGKAQLQEGLDSQAASDENKVETEQQKVSEEGEPSEEPARRQGMDNFAARGRSFKRKMRGGRGGKWMRTFDGSRRPVVPPKPKEVVPLICDLCNVKCDSPAVFESHLTGKKHLANLKRFQGYQAMLGQAALQALYPALQALYPALQALYQPIANASSSFPQNNQPDDHGPRGFSMQPGSSVFQGQSSASGLATTTLASAPPSVSETHGQQDSKLQYSTSVGESQNAIAGEKSDQVALHKGMVQPHLKGEEPTE